MQLHIFRHQTKSVICTFIILKERYTPSFCNDRDDIQGLSLTESNVHIFFLLQQSLNMYVPPDELAIRDYGEVNMTLGDDGMSQAQHIGSDPRVAAAVNPMYNEG